MRRAETLNVLALLDQGMIDPEQVILACLLSMPDADAGRMREVNEWPIAHEGLRRYRAVTLALRDSEQAVNVL